MAVGDLSFKLNGGVEEPTLARVKVNSEGENYLNVMKLSKTLSFVFIYHLLKVFSSIRCWSSLFFMSNWIFLYSVCCVCTQCQSVDKIVLWCIDLKRVKE